MSTNPYKAPRPRGRPAGSTAGAGSTSKSTKAPPAKAKAPLAKRPAQQRAAAAQDESDVDPFADSQPDPSSRDDDIMEVVDDDDEDEDDDDVDPPKTIPPELLTRILHTSFEKEGTRISKDANKAVAQYMDIFVRESIARAALEKEAGFLEVRSFVGE